MNSREECCLCSPDFGGDTVCDECKDKAAGYDDLRGRLTAVGLMLRHALKTAPAGSLVLAEIMVGLDLIKPEMDAVDARDARIAAWCAAPYGTALEASQVLQETLHGTGELAL